MRPRALVVVLLLGALGCQRPRRASNWPPAPPDRPVRPFVLGRLDAQEVLQAAQALGTHPDAATCTAVAEKLSAIAERRNYQEAHYNLGIVLLRCDRRREAKKAFENALGFNDKFGAARLQLALFLVESDTAGAVDKAIAQIERAIRDDEYRAPEALLHLAALQMRRDSAKAQGRDGNDEAAALMNIQRATAIAPDWPEAVAALAQYYHWLAHKRSRAGAPQPGLLELGVRTSRTGLERHPNSGVLHHTLGVGLWQQGDLEGAGVAFLQAIHHGSVASGIALGAVRLTQRQPKLATAAYQRVLAIFDSHVEAHLGMANAALMLRDLELAKRHIGRCLSNAQKDPDVLLTAAAVAERSGDPSRAKKLRARAEAARTQKGQP